VGTIIFKSPPGETAVPFNDGQSVMRVAVEHDIPGIIGECGGELSCGTCHVIICPDWWDRIPSATRDELDMLAIVDEPQPTSRLGCQIVLDGTADGIEVSVPQ
jgi:2Fe-2S ferredoxin